MSATSSRYGEGFVYRLVVDYEPRGGIAGVLRYRVACSLVGIQKARSGARLRRWSASSRRLSNSPRRTGRGHPLGQQSGSNCLKSLGSTSCASMRGESPRTPHQQGRSRTPHRWFMSRPWTWPVTPEVAGSSPVSRSPLQKLAAIRPNLLLSLAMRVKISGWNGRLPKLEHVGALTRTFERPRRRTAQIPARAEPATDSEPATGLVRCSHGAYDGPREADQLRWQRRQGQGRRRALGEGAGAIRRTIPISSARSPATTSSRRPKRSRRPCSTPPQQAPVDALHGRAGRDPSSSRSRTRRRS